MLRPFSPVQDRISRCSSGSRFRKLNARMQLSACCFAFASKGTFHAVNRVQEQEWNPTSLIQCGGILLTHRTMDTGQSIRLTALGSVWLPKRSGNALLWERDIHRIVMINIIKIAQNRPTQVSNSARPRAVTQRSRLHVYRPASSCVLGRSSTTGTGEVSLLGLLVLICVDAGQRP